MIDKMCEEIILRKDYLSDRTLKSIYFGGGTPSLLREEELAKIFSTIQAHFEINPAAEITLEANPDDVDLINLKSWKNAGINRLSIGIQSFKQTDLDWMNRAHRVEQALSAVDLAKRSGINNITIDLIYGLPELTNEEWKNHLEKAIELEIDHISAYFLTVEERTALHTMIKKGKIAPGGEDQQSEQFKILVDTLTLHGFEQYEISNFARNERYAVHNTSYWLGADYLGIGPSAHSFNGTERRWNISNNTVYIKSVGQNHDWFESEQLTPKDRWNELILTGLRTKFGVDLNTLMQIASPTKNFYAKIEDFQANGMMIINNERLTLTLTGRLQADYISSELFL
jgi:oxygen-independent coproporphyrinogen-3 oxidase